MNRTVEGRPWDVVGTRLADGRWRVTGFSALAVLCASLAVQPLLDGGWWLPWAALTVTIIAVVGGLVRSMHLPAPLQPLAEAAALLVTLTFLFARDEARWGFLPGPAAIARLQDLAVQGREYADTTQAPAASDTGLLLLIVAGIGLVALAADTLSAGLDLPGMTLVPLGALFVAPWAINRGHAPGWTFVVVAAAWFGVLAATQRERTSLWSPQARPGSPGVGLLVATAVTGMALLAGGLASLRGPVLEVSPGAGRGDRAVTVDALVSLRRSLVSNDTRPVITLATTATRPDYLRLSVLELFDGEQWQPVGPNETGPQAPARADGSVPSADQRPGGPVAEYQLDVGPLGGTTLPSPNGSYLSLTDWPVVWDQRTSLPLRADGDTVEGARIGLVATAQDLEADDLRAASRVPPSPEQVFGENLADPTPVTGPELPQLARDITAGSATPFDAAVALQRWFTTDGGFTLLDADRGRIRRGRPEGLPGGASGVLRAVRCDDGPDGPVGRHPGESRGRVHPGSPRGQPMGGARDRCPRLARALDGLGRVGEVRADTRSPDDDEPQLHPRHSGRADLVTQCFRVIVRTVGEAHEAPRRGADRCHRSHDRTGRSGADHRPRRHRAPAPAPRSCSARSPSAPTAFR